MKRNWKFIGGKVTGRSHISREIPCQDSFSYLNDDVKVIAVADGAGSKKYSDDGSRIAVDTVTEIFKGRFDQLYNLPNEQIVDIVLSNVLENVKNDASNKNRNEMEYGATLLFVAIKDDKYLYGRLGDGVIGALKANKTVVLSTEFKLGAVNETYFFTSAGASENFEIKKDVLTDDLDGFVLMTDGSADSLVDSFDKDNIEFAKFVLRLFNLLIENDSKDVDDFLQKVLDEKISKKTTDDCTVAMCTFSKLDKVSIKEEVNETVEISNNDKETIRVSNEEVKEEILDVVIPNDSTVESNIVTLKEAVVGSEIEHVNEDKVIDEIIQVKEPSVDIDVIEVDDDVKVTQQEESSCESIKEDLKRISNTNTSRTKSYVSIFSLNKQLGHGKKISSIGNKMRNFKLCLGRKNNKNSTKNSMKRK